ncbi:MAG: DUF1893 domain-containing protein [Bacilli bacterium]|nr:DUF1893 domain-containing protein [Bacilli bacterium]MBN2876294.1 DUF1893 domain-containing protein [Bacilli bacterium]
MEKQLDKYLILLNQEKASCFIYSEDKLVFRSNKNGVGPMIDFYNSHGKQYHNLVVVDKIMGRAAVLLSILIGATTIITNTMSDPAIELAKLYELEYHFKSNVPYIINRTKTGQCPIESSGIGITDINIGYQAIINKLNSLK